MSSPAEPEIPTRSESIEWTRFSLFSERGTGATDVEPTVSPALLHGISDRRGGISPEPFDCLNLSTKTGDAEENVATNRRIFQAGFGSGARAVTIGKLEHGADVVTFGVGRLMPHLTREAHAWPAFEGDAAVSDIPGLVIVMTFADCVPVLLWAPDQSVCAMAHGGWRGTAAHVAARTVAVMRDTFGCDPEEIRAGIGPSIGPCCYEVGLDVRAVFEKAYDGATVVNDRLDLWSATRRDLRCAGIRDSNIESAGVCTACRSDVFFSHRAERGATGRFGAFIGIPWREA